MKRTMGIVCCILLGVGVSQAQVTFKVGGSVGMTTGGQDNEVWGSLPTGGDLETHKPLYGVQAVAQLTPRFSLELAGLSLTDKDWEERFGISMATGDIRFYPITLTARYAIPFFQDTFRIYGLAGVGDYIFDDINLSITGTENAPGFLAVGNHPKMTVDNTFGYHVGLGVEWPVWRNIELFAEYRFAVTDPHAHMKGVTALNSQGQYVFDAFVQDISDNRDIGLARVGVNYVF